MSRCVGKQIQLRPKEQATLNALSEAGLEAGNGLVEMILDKEKSEME